MPVVEGELKNRHILLKQIEFLSKLTFSLQSKSLFKFHPLQAVQ